MRLRCAATGNPAPTVVWSKVPRGVIPLGSWQGTISNTKSLRHQGVEVATGHKRDQRHRRIKIESYVATYWTGRGTGPLNDVR